MPFLNPDPDDFDWPDEMIEAAFSPIKPRSVAQRVYDELVRKHGPVWIDREGNFCPVALMTRRYLTNIARFLERQWGTLCAELGLDPEQAEEAIEKRHRPRIAWDLLDKADSDWYPGDLALFDEMDAVSETYDALREIARWRGIIRAELEKRSEP